MATYVPDPYDPTQPVGTVKAKTAAEEFRLFKAAAALLARINVFTKNQSVTPVTLVSGTNIAVDASLSNNFKLVLGTNATLDNPTNLTDGMVLNFKIKQDGTGSRTLAYGSKYDFPGGIAPVLSTAANDYDFMSCYYDSTEDRLLCNMLKDFS